MSIQEIETSLEIFEDCKVSRELVPNAIIPLLLGLEAIDCEFNQKDVAQWAFTTIDIEFSSPPIHLCISYLTVIPVGSIGLIHTDSDMIETLSSCLKVAVKERLYPNVLPFIWINGSTNSDLVPAAERLNLSLNLLHRLMDSRRLCNDSDGHATTVLYDLWTIAISYSNSEYSHLVQSPPDALLPEDEKILKKEREMKQAASAAAALRIATRRKEAASASGTANHSSNKKDTITGGSRSTLGVGYQGIPYISPSLEASMCREDRALMQAQTAKASQSDYIRSQKARSTLPVASYKEAVLKLVKENQVVLLSGATGCGKTTQVPQFILEDAIAKGKGGHTRILCTQPRRIAAIGVAQRVAQERCEPLGVIGGCVGFQIRGEKKAHAGTNLLFSTTGVLLRRLNQSGLGHVTHIIVDEVHERNVDTDFLLAVLRRLLPQRPDVKVVLMSATMDAASFAKYFEANAVSQGDKESNSKGIVPVIEVPGFVHPVEEVYLERVLEMTGYIPKLRDSRGRDRTGGKTPTTAPLIKKVGQFENTNTDESLEDEYETRDLLSSSSSSSSEVIDSPSGLDLRCWKTHGLDFGLVASLVHHVASPSGPHSGDDGSVLVFMPGSVEIRRLQNEIERYGRTGHMQILPLHGSLSPDEQQLVFRRPPIGKRKIVLATNVAETSITIDDVTVVIDTFRVKENTFDSLNQMSKLQETWTSVAASKQRRGRAGRVRPGTCYRLIPRAMLDTLSLQTTPEIMRTPLESLCLQAKLLRMGKIVDFMSSLLDPPPIRSLQSALRNLIDIGALQLVRRDSSINELVDYELTPLGYHIALLPLDVGLAKALIFGAMLRCVDPVLTIVAALSDRSPFRPIIPSMMDEETRAAMEAARAKFTWGQSDHLAIVRAYNSWRDCSTYSAKKAFAEEHFLSNDTLRTIDETRHELAGALADMGFLRGGGRMSQGIGKLGGDGKKNSGGRGGSGSGSGRFGELSIESNFYSEQLNVIRAALVAGLYPKVVKVVAPERKYNETSAGAIAADHVAKELKFFTLQDDDSKDAGMIKYENSSSSGNGTGSKKSAQISSSVTIEKEEDEEEDEEDDEDEDDDDDLNNQVETSGPDGRLTVKSKRGFVQERIFLHPSSFCFSIGEFRCPFLVFHEKAATNKTYIRDASVTTPYAMVLFGGPLVVHHREGRVSVGNRRWVTFRAEPRVAVLAKGLRQALARLLAAKISNPQIDICSHPVIEAIAHLLKSNGQ
jgi:HrpA-like RNA helicase